MLNRKNALRCATANLATGLVLACALLPTQRALADCLTTDNNGNRIFSNPANGSGVQNGNNAFAPEVTGTTNQRVTTCASGSGSVALGDWSFTSAGDSVAIGSRSTIDTTASGSIAIGLRSYVGNSDRTNTGVAGHASIAIGSDSRVNDGHVYSVALGRYAQTTARDQFAFGTSARTFTAGVDSQGRRIVNRGGSTQFPALVATAQSTYRFAGLAIAEDDLAGITTARITGNFGSTDATRKAEYDKMVARDGEVAAAREAAANRVLGVNGHGDLVALGNVSEFMGGGSGGISAATQAKIDAIGSSDDAASATGSLYARINKNRADIASFQSAGVSSETMAQIDGNTARSTQNAQGVEKNSQGVALSNALSAIPNYLEPGKKLFLGIGAGSFDGKSATAIGVTGKFGASTLLNAGFATGGGESSTRIGIGWSW